MMRPRWLRDLDARPTRGLAEENSGLADEGIGLAEEDIGRSATPGPTVERAQLPLLVAPNIGTGPGRRAHSRFDTLFGELALAIPTATITAFVAFWAFTTAWTHGPSSRAADGNSGPTQAAVVRGTQGAKGQPISPRARLALLQAPSGRVEIGRAS